MAAWNKACNDGWMYILIWLFITKHKIIYYYYHQLILSGVSISLVPPTVPNYWCLSDILCHFPMPSCQLSSTFSLHLYKSYLFVTLNTNLKQVFATSLWQDHFFKTAHRNLWAMFNHNPLVLWIAYFAEDSHSSKCLTVKVPRETLGQIGLVP